MRHLRSSLVLVIVSVGLLLMSQAALAQNGQGQNCTPGGNNQGGGGQGCSPGGPVLSESHFAVLLPLIAIALVGGLICVVYLRRRTLARAAD